jgi:hypothetical protein
MEGKVPSHVQAREPGIGINLPIEGKAKLPEGSIICTVF